jgi:hypothetical protein
LSGKEPPTVLTLAESILPRSTISETVVTGEPATADHESGGLPGITY